MIKLSYIALGLLFVQATFAQQKKPDLPINPKTKLVSIRDSIKVGPNYSPWSMMKLLSNWSNFTTDYNGPALLRQVNNDKEVRFYCITSYNDPSNRNSKDVHLVFRSRKDQSDTSKYLNGELTCHLLFNVSGQYLTYEFTECSFMSEKTELGKFEDPQLLSNDGFHFLTEKQKPWSRIKKHYLDGVSIISNDLKRFLASHYQHPDQPLHTNEHW